MSQFRSAMSAARNHGSAGTGTGEFVQERFTALVLILLGIVLGAKLLVLSAGGIDLAEARGWLGSPVNAGLMLAFFYFGMVHAFICSKVLLEDYVHIHGLKLLLIAGVAVLTTGAGVVATVSVLTSLFMALS
ncbi:MAG: succinate dehydrogenase, hydrophobic membrane anchor protein [Immundisolibacteraceae bacterium]|nr:succinate dehydrogenase, hydrophobic membrane anchor protein [Immundisolibacteraceae bacterium]